MSSGHQVEARVGVVVTVVVIVVMLDAWLLDSEALETCSEPSVESFQVERAYDLSI
jgi:hypothetical protein